MNKVKPIVLHDTETGADYTLEFNRDSIRFAEERGFHVDDVARYPMTKLPEWFFYAFRMHHKSVSREKTDKMFDEISPLPDGFIERLGELYAVPYNSLYATDDEPKNSKMTVEL